MSDCTRCTFAEWKRTSSGRLHPSGDGRCTWNECANWRIPAAFYYADETDKRVAPAPCGGYINRRTPESASECACFRENLSKR